MRIPCRKRRQLNDKRRERERERKKKERKKQGRERARERMDRKRQKERERERKREKEREREREKEREREINLSPWQVYSELAVKRFGPPVDMCHLVLAGGFLSHQVASTRASLETNLHSVLSNTTQS